MYNYILITLTIVFIVDLSGFTDSFLRWVSAYEGKKVTSFKPFTCSLCLTWWVLLIYSLLTGITIGKIALSACCAFLTYPTGQMLMLVSDFINTIIKKLYQWIDKI